LPSGVDGQNQPHPGLPSSHEGTTILRDRVVRYIFKIYKNGGNVMDAKERRRRMCSCVETVASLVCTTDVKLSLFGELEELGEVLSELGDKERTNDPLTISSNPSFTLRWTCLSLMAIWKMLDSNSVQEVAAFALNGILPHRTEWGDPDIMLLTAALRIDDYLTNAWASVEHLQLALQSWRIRTESEIKEILNDRGASLAVSELESIANEADEVKCVDWRIALLQNTMDEASHKLTRCLPGVFFTEPETITPTPVETTPVLPQLIFPGQLIQNLCTFGGKLRDIMKGQHPERNEETLKSLDFLHGIPIPLRGLKFLMKRQIWRLMDLRDGGGLGFTVELFFLTLRQFLSTPESTPLSSELEDFYMGTFNVITSNWKTKNSVGTQQILLNLLCDIVIRSRGVFSNVSYPSCIVDMLLVLVGEMVEEHIGSPDHINDIIQELEDIDGYRVDNTLRAKVLGILRPAQAQDEN
jgi:hypothetical protein